MSRALAFFCDFFIFPTLKKEVKFRERHPPVLFKKVEISKNQIFWK